MRSDCNWLTHLWVKSSDVESIPDLNRCAPATVRALVSTAMGLLERGRLGEASPVPWRAEADKCGIG